MKNIIITFVLFFSLCATIIFSLNYLGNISTSIEKKCDVLEEKLQAEDWEKAYSLSLEMVDNWENYSKKLSIFIHHQELDNIDAELWKLPQYVKEHSKDEALASVHVIKFFIKHVDKLEKLNTQNLF